MCPQAGTTHERVLFIFREVGGESESRSAMACPPRGTCLDVGIPSRTGDVVSHSLRRVKGKSGLASRMHSLAQVHKWPSISRSSSSGSVIRSWSVPFDYAADGIEKSTMSQMHKELTNGLGLHFPRRFRHLSVGRAIQCATK